MEIYEGYGKMDENDDGKLIDDDSKDSTDISPETW